MGVAFHELMWLKKAASSRPLGAVLTLGRQSLNVDPGVLEKTLHDSRFDQDVYCDRLLTDCLRATSVESVDFSDFEGATHIADLNRPLEIGRQFDTVIDFGTTEHIFSISTALENCIRHCRVGGSILHAVPANGECGHGFYQLSPELFFSLYSPQNGFGDTQVYVADLMDEKHWWRASPPEPGARLMANSFTATYVLVATRKEREVSTLSVNQSDYRHAWQVGEAQGNDRESWRSHARAVLKNSPFAHLASIVYRGYAAPTGLTRFNRCLTKVPVQQAVEE